MKLLFDESVPRTLARAFPESFTVHTVQTMGWGGTRNGPLLSLAATEDVDAFITVDRGIEYQQNTSNVPLPIIIMLAFRNQVSHLRPLVPEVLTILANNPQPGIHRVENPKA